MEKGIVRHNIEPVYDENSRILILGTMPSPRSRESGFYYGHPQNRFWKTLAGVFGESAPEGNDEKRGFVLRHGIALWDVLSECTIRGASDSSIRDEKPNDIAGLLKKTGISRVCTTGRAAFDYYMKYCFAETGIEPVYLPSPSAANCARYTIEDLVREYSVLLSL